MLNSKFPLSRSLRNDTGLVTQRLNTKTFLRANRHAIMPIHELKNDPDTENKQQSTFQMCFA